MENQNKDKDSLVGRIIYVLLSYFTKERILKFLEDKMIKFALKKLLIVGGLKAWLIAFVIGEVLEEADEHLIEPALRSINLLKDISDGRKVFGRIENAEDFDDWLDAARDA